VYWWNESDLMTKDNVDLICSVAELAGLFEKSTGLMDFLQAVVGTVAHHMKAAVCSVYLYDERREELVLRANQGLSPGAVDELRIGHDEGIIGLALRELRPIRVARGSAHPSFKFIPGIDEEKYEAFLAVPILRGLSRIGVLVVQDPKPDYFDENDTKALQAIAAQLAASIENAQLLINLHQRDERQSQEHRAAQREALSVPIKGVSASDGFAYGRVTVWQQDRFSVTQPPPGIADGRTEEDFVQAVQEAEQQIRDIQLRLEEEFSDVSSLIFSAHLLILRDETFSGAMRKRIRAGTPPVEAIIDVLNEYVRLFAESSNPKLREKVSDVRDVGHRLLSNLTGRTDKTSEYEDEIVVAQELMPSDIVKLVTEGAEGIILLGGTPNSHVSVLARSLGIPMVITEDERVLQLDAQTRIQIDARQGNIFVNPNSEIVENYARLATSEADVEQSASGVEAETYSRDGCRMHLLANVNLLSDLDLALRMKAEGVGLYRSEIPFLVRNDFPSEEEQYRIYRRLVERMAGREVTLRTLDVGGDKMLSYFHNVSEANPFLGLRAIRFSLRNKRIFTQQLRAMLRAGADADVMIVFPLISSVDDFVQAGEVVNECLQALAREGLPHNERPRLGVMIETPSAAEVADELAQEAALLCIGANDLVQYTLAVDRTNKQLSELYLSYHPAVIRSLRKITAAALRHGTRLAICGEVAGDTKMLPFLVGIGIRRFSLEAKEIPRVQQAIQAIDVNEAEAHAAEMLRLGRVSEVRHYLESQIASGLESRRS